MGMPQEERKDKDEKSTHQHAVDIESDQESSVELKEARKEGGHANFSESEPDKLYIDGKELC